MNNTNKFMLALLAFAAPAFVHAKTITLDFDKDANGNTIKHGQIIDNEYSDLGVAITAQNTSRNHNIATTYASSGTIKYNDDPDLRSSWNGGNVKDRNYNAGNILIIQESTSSCNLMICKRPDDEGSRPAGSLSFNFGFSLDSFSFDLIDIERPETSGANVAFLDKSGQVLSGSSLSFASLGKSNKAVWGDNTYNTISTIDVNNTSFLGRVFGLKFSMGGSGALNNVVVSHSVPEIDAASSGIALALLGGLMAVFRERKKRA